MGAGEGGGGGAGFGASRGGGVYSHQSRPNWDAGVE